MSRTQSDGTTKILERAKVLLDPEKPMTLRHLWYLLVSEGVLQNTIKTATPEYRKLMRVMKIGRKRGEIDYECLVDNLRQSYKPSSWSGLADFLDTVAQAYRKDLWAAQEDYIEIWCEKDAIASVVQDVTATYDVRIRPMRGSSSISNLYQAGKEIEAIEKPITIYYVGDFDPKGFDIERSCKKGLLEILDDKFGGLHYELKWVRLAIIDGDFENEDFNLIPLLPKTTDRTFPRFLAEHGNRAAELDALPPDELRTRIENAILSHVDMVAWEALQKQDQREKATFDRSLAQMLAKLKK